MSAERVDPIDHGSGAVRLVKQAAPWLTRAIRRLRLTATVDRAATMLHVLGGQGAGAGWDKSEIIAAAGVLRGVASPVIVDCGANAGNWTRDVRARLGHRTGRWILVEPTAEYLARLRAIPGVDVIAAAAGDVAEVRDFHVPTEESGWMSLHERGDTFAQAKRFVTRSVAVVRLEDELAQREISAVDFLKLDVEGHELFAIRGLGRYLQQRRVRALAFEFGAAHVNSRTFFRDFWDLLSPLGYRISRIAPGGTLVPIPAYYETLEYFRGATNYLAQLDP